MSVLGLDLTGVWSADSRKCLTVSVLAAHVFDVPPQKVEARAVSPERVARPSVILARRPGSAGAEKLALVSAERGSWGGRRTFARVSALLPSALVS